MRKCNRKMEANEERELQRERGGNDAYDEFNDVNGRRRGGAKSRNTEIKTTSEELFGLILSLRREVWVNTSATVHRYCPPSHCLSLSPFCV